MRKIFLSMPAGVNALYFIQIASTFSFAVLYSCLALFLTKQLGLAEITSNRIIALFFAFNYAMQLVTGLIGGRFLSNRTIFFISLLIESLGLLCLASLDITFLYLGLTLFLIGCGLNTTCFNTILTQRFQPEDNRRENAFILSYAAMNVGFFIGFFWSGFYDFDNRYEHLFYIALVINIIAQCLIIRHWRSLADITTPLALMSGGRSKKRVIGYGLLCLMVPLLFFGFSVPKIGNQLVIVVSAILFLVIFIIGKRMHNQMDRQRIKTYLILALTSICFWTLYYTGPMGITLFVKNNVDKHLFGYTVATQWIFNVNSMVIIGVSPLLTMLLNFLQRQGYHFSIPKQFACSFILLALAFFALANGIIFANDAGYSSIIWAIAYQILLGLSELFIGPIGYAMIGRIAPLHLQGVLMGAWMMVSGVAASFSQYFSNQMTAISSDNPLLTNPDYLKTFEEIGCIALAGSILLYLLFRKTQQLIESAV